MDRLSSLTFTVRHKFLYKLYWGDSKMTGRVKLQTGLIDNLTPTGDRAPPKIIMKKKIRILEFIKKCCFLTWKTQIGGQFAGAPCDQNLFFLLPIDSVNSKLGCKSSFDKIRRLGVIWGQIFDFSLKIP